MLRSADVNIPRAVGHVVPHVPGCGRLAKYPAVFSLRKVKACCRHTNLKPKSQRQRGCSNRNGNVVVRGEQKIPKFEKHDCLCSATCPSRIPLHLLHHISPFQASQLQERKVFPYLPLLKCLHHPYSPTSKPQHFRVISYLSLSHHT